MAQATKKTAAKNKADGGMDLRGLLVIKIRILYGGASELSKALPAMAKKANDADLKGIFEERAEQTEDHMKRLLQVCELLGVKAQKMQSQALSGLVADAEWVAKNIKGDAVSDAGLAAAACMIASHEVVGYETAITWAKLLEEDEVANLLEETLDEEDDFCEELNDLAELKLDEKALPEGFGEGEKEDDEEEEDDDDDGEDKK